MKAMLTTMVFFLLMGCSGLDVLQEKESEVRLVAMYATIKIVDGDPDRAARVERIAAEVRDYASGEKQLSVSLLMDQIRARVPWTNLDPADTLLVDALLAELEYRLVDRLCATQLREWTNEGGDRDAFRCGPTTALPSELRIAADTVSGWVIEAARLTS